MGYHTAHLCATFDTNESLSPEIEFRYEAKQQQLASRSGNTRIRTNAISGIKYEFD
jgi:hypothetical protein